MSLSKAKQSILAGALTVTALVGAVNSGSFTRLSLWVVTGLSGALTVRSLVEVKAEDLAIAAWQFGLELFTDMPTAAPEPEASAPEVVTAKAQTSTALDFLRGALEDATTSGFWTLDRASQPAVMVGKRRSGKSKLASYKMQQRYNAGHLVMIADYHFDPANPDNPEHVNWLPGIDLVETGILIRSEHELIGSIHKLLEEGRARLKGERSKDQAIELMVDEWEGWMNRLSEEDAEFCGKAMQEVSYEFAKVGVSMSFTCKSIKKGQTALDSTIFDGADLYLMGPAINARHQAWPADLASDREKLSSLRDHLISRVGVAQRVAVYRDALEGTSQVVVAPNLTQQQFVFQTPEQELSQFLQTHESAIAEFAGQAKSLRQLTEHLGIRRAGPVYEAVKARFEQLAAAPVAA